MGKPTNLVVRVERILYMEACVCASVYINVQCAPQLFCALLFAILVAFAGHYYTHTPHVNQINESMNQIKSNRIESNQRY